MFLSGPLMFLVLKESMSTFTCFFNQYWILKQNAMEFFNAKFFHGFRFQRLCCWHPLDRNRSHYSCVCISGLAENFMLSLSILLPSLSLSLFDRTLGVSSVEQNGLNRNTSIACIPNGKYCCIHRNGMEMFIADCSRSIE